MSPGEHRLFEFVADRIASLLERPAMWGSLESVEDQLLQLLELRRVLLAPSMKLPCTQELMQAYGSFIAAEIGRRSPETLARQLQRLDRANEFSALFSRFVERELAIFVAQQAAASDAGELASPSKIDATERVLACLRSEIARQPVTTAVVFRAPELS